MQWGRTVHNRSTSADELDRWIIKQRSMQTDNHGNSTKPNATTHNSSQCTSSTKYEYINA